MAAFPVMQQLFFTQPCNFSNNYKHICRKRGSFPNRGGSGRGCQQQPLPGLRKQNGVADRRIQQAGGQCEAVNIVASLPYDCTPAALILQADWPMQGGLDGILGVQTVVMACRQAAAVALIKGWLLLGPLGMCTPGRGVCKLSWQLTCALECLLQSMFSY